MPNFTTPEPIIVIVDASAGDIRVTASDRTDTVVEVRPGKPDRKTDVAAAEQTTVHYANGELRITAPKQPNRPGKLRVVDMDIAVPAGSTLRGKTHLGPLRTEGRLAAVDFDLDSGDITVDATGTANLSTKLGDVLIGRAGDSVTAKAVKGNVRVVEAVSGDVTVTTTHGDVVVGVAQDTAVTNLKTATMLGSVSNGLDAAGHGRTPTASAVIELSATVGDLSVHRSSGDTSAVRS